jgi:hypothetical protein
MKMENILQYWGLLGGARSASGAFDYEKHEESAAGISQRMRAVPEQLQSTNLASPVYKKTHVSWPSFASFGCPLFQVDLSTGVPSAQLNCPGVRPMSEADTQNQCQSAIERKVVNFNLKSISHSFLPLARLLSSLSTASNWTQSFESRHLHSSLRAPLTRFVPSYILLKERKLNQCKIQAKN